MDVKGNPTQFWPLVHKQLQPVQECGYLSEVKYNITASPYASVSQPVFKVQTRTYHIRWNRQPRQVQRDQHWLRRTVSSLPLRRQLRRRTARIPHQRFQVPRRVASLSFLSPSITSHPLRFCTTSDPFSPPSLTVSTERFAHPPRPLGLGTRPWPISWRDHIWKALAEEEAGL